MYLNYLSLLQFVGRRTQRLDVPCCDGNRGQSLLIGHRVHHNVVLSALLVILNKADDEKILLRLQEVLDNCETQLSVFT